MKYAIKPKDLNITDIHISILVYQLIKREKRGRIWLVRQSPNFACTNASKKMDAETKNFVENVDSWIKQIRSEFNQITDVSGIVEENVSNVQHNYELIYELKEELDSIREEIKALKLIQLLQIKDKLVKKA